MNRLASALIAAVCIALWIALLPAGSGADPLDAHSSPEALLLDPLPEVFTANRFKQQVDRAASAVSVITSDEIERYGLQSLAEVFRYIAGVHVAGTTASNFNVGMRGFNKDVSNKILVMVDGRSVYYDFYGHYWWYSLPVPIEEIRQIEIIRGPGSSLYGANAFDGVIHILTKKPGELSRGTGVAAYGSRQTHRVAAITSYADEDLGVKLSGEVFRNQAWRDRDEDSAQAERFNLYLERLFGEDGMASLALGRSLLDNEFLSEFLPGRLDNEIRIDYLQGVVRKNGLTVQGFVTGIDMANMPEIEAITTRPDAESTTYDLEINYQRRIGGHLLVGGATYRRNEVQSTLFNDTSGGTTSAIDTSRVQHLYGVYLQDSLALTKGLEVVAGLRLDHHTLTDVNVSPRVAFLYTPVSGHTFRAAYARAFRNPSFAEAYIGNGTLNGFLVDDELADPEDLDLRPDLNADPDPESLTSWELGYRGQIGHRVAAHMDVYYNQVDDLIEVRDFETEPGHISQLIRNFASGRAYGVEVEAEIALSHSLETFANATYQRVWFDDHADPTFGPSGFLADGAPRWLGNLGVRYRAPAGTFGTLVVHHTDGWQAFPSLIRRLELEGGGSVASFAVPEEIDPYTVVNASLGWREQHGLSVVVSVLNLLGNKHFEFAPENHRFGDLGEPVPQGEASEEIGRELVVQVKYEF